MGLKQKSHSWYSNFNGKTNVGFLGKSTAPSGTNNPGDPLPGLSDGDWFRDLRN
jgi:hypothetical protein